MILCKRKLIQLSRNLRLLSEKKDKRDDLKCYHLSRFKKVLFKYSIHFHNPDGED